MSRKESGSRSWIAGGIAGTIGTVIGYPLDTLKVRVQTRSLDGAGGVKSALARVRSDGFFSLWRGVSVPIGSRAVIKSTLYSTYGYCNKNWQTAYKKDKLETWQYAVSGGLGGVASSLVQTPVDFVKVRLQTTPEHLPVSGRISHILETAIPRSASGFNTARVMYRGYPAMLGREVAGFSVYFSLFEHLKQTFRFQGSPAGVFMAGSFVGCVSWCIQFPFDMIKARMQASNDFSMTTRRMLATTVRNEGVRVLYRGLSTALLRACFVHGTVMTTYETILDSLNRRQQQQLKLAL
ncbi:Protein dif-1 [Diplonema papillatum]|nr:Protein dif-1 [Diplonema papillatum]|eukprot:gene9470-14702_t